MDRGRAALTHLGISAIVVCIILAVVFLVWYPFPTFKIAGTMSPVAVLVGVDLIVGPLLTLIVYRAGKPGLKFDLAVIALIQVIALSYGTLTLWKSKPGYLLFVADRFQLVAEHHIERDSVPEEVIESSSGDRLVRAFTALPDDPEANARYWDAVAATGADLDSMPEFWTPLAENAGRVRDGSLRLDDFEPGNGDEERIIAGLRQQYAAVSGELLLAPVGGIEADLTAILDPESLEILDVLPLNVWGQAARGARNPHEPVGP